MEITISVSQLASLNKHNMLMKKMDKVIVSRFSVEKLKLKWKIILKGTRIKVLKASFFVILGAWKQKEVLKFWKELCINIPHLFFSFWLVIYIPGNSHHPRDPSSPLDSSQGFGTPFASGKGWQNRIQTIPLKFQKPASKLGDKDLKECEIGPSQVTPS